MGDRGVGASFLVGAGLAAPTDGAPVAVTPARELFRNAELQGLEALRCEARFR